MTEPSLASFDRLVAEHQNGVFRVCRAILRDEHLGADAAQETFLRLWSRLRRGELPRHFAAWLNRVAVNASLDIARRVRAREDRGVEEDAEERLAGREDPAGEAAEHELLDRFELAVRELSDGQRTIFLLRHEGGLSLSEIASLLEVSHSTVKTQFARAALKLQERLSTYDPRRTP